MSRTWKVFAVLLFALTATADESVRQLYERARLLQERNRRLDEAIRIYGRVVELAKGNRSLAARALLEQGVLYLRLGRDEDAREAFRKILHEFPDQLDAAREARVRLGLNGDGRTLASRQVWVRSVSDDVHATSPDGRYISFNNAAGELNIRDLSTGESRRLTLKSSTSAPGVAIFSSFSPDGKHIAYWWLVDGHINQVRIVGTDGSGPRVLCTIEDSTLIWVRNWSPDGRSILADIQYRNAPEQIALIATSDGSRRVLREVNTWPGKMSFSPDGKFILHDGPGSPGRDIYLLAVDTGADVAVAPHPAEEFSIGWSPDGGQILFGSNRTGPVSLWKLAVKNGLAEGEPRLLRANLGPIEPLGVTRSGAVYYMLHSGLNDIYTALIDTERASVIEGPKSVPSRFVGSNRFPNWSPDGKSLLYQSTRPGDELVIVIRSLADGTERDVRPPPSLRFSNPHWSATSDAIFAPGTLDGKKGIYRIDPRTGAVTLAVELPRDKILFAPSWSPDGRTLFGRFQNFDGVQRMDVATRVIRPLYNPADPPGPFAANDTGPSDPLVSPDGRSVLFQQRDRPRTDNLLIVPAEGGTPRVFHSGRWPDEPFTPRGYEWTPDSRKVLFVQRKAGQSALFLAPVEGGELRILGIRIGGIQSLSLHADGRRLAFEGGYGSAEVWVLENLF